MPNVSNAELLKQITQFQDDFNSKYDGMNKLNDERNATLVGKIDEFSRRLDQLDQKFDTIEENHLVHVGKFEEIDTQIDECL